MAQELPGRPPFQPAFACIRNHAIRAPVWSSIQNVNMGACASSLWGAWTISSLPWPLLQHAAAAPTPHPLHTPLTFAAASGLLYVVTHGLPHDAGERKDRARRVRGIHPVAAAPRSDLQNGPSAGAIGCTREEQGKAEGAGEREDSLSCRSCQLTKRMPACALLLV